jgi:hypothetical protein
MATKTAKKSRTAAPKKLVKKPAKKLSKKTAPKRASVAHAAKPGTQVRDAALAYLAFTHSMLKDYTKPFTAANATTQPANNANHIIWSLGHLADSYHWFASQIDGGKVDQAPAGYHDLFAMNTTPTDEPSKYPSLADVTKAYDAGLARMEKAAAKLDDATLLALPVGNSDGWMTTNLDVIMKCGWHNAWHLGQVANIRRVLGITSKK